jgi:tRNA threonylcarbamoyladenosine biosynthesis protein TsaE
LSSSNLFHTSHHITINLPDEAATLAAGARLATLLPPGITIYLHGDLGAGKTTFVRGVLQAMGHTGRVKSPTYTLVEPYRLSALNSVLDVYHFDLYRLIDPEEWEGAGFRDYFNQASVCMVEWPEKAGSLLPPPDIDIYLTHLDDGRELALLAHTQLGDEVLKCFSDD